MERKAYKVEEAARLLGISRAQAYKPGVLPTFRIGRRILVDAEALDEMIRRLREQEEAARGHGFG
jgi:excisionase family DNA binding protein